MARPLVEVELPSVDRPGTYGEVAFVQHRLAGARGEAASGYASVRLRALPAYRAVLEDLQWLPAASAFRGLLELPLRFTPTPTPGGPR